MTNPNDSQILQTITPMTDHQDRRISGILTGKNYNLDALSAVLPEQISDAIIVTDAPSDNSDNRIIYANASFLEMTGYSLEEVIGKSPKFLQGPATDRATLDRARTAIKNETYFYGTAVNYRKNGEPYIISWKLVPVKNRVGETVQWLAIQQDISEKLKVESSFKELESRLKLMLQSLDEGIWYWDLNTNAFACSERLMGIFRISDTAFIPSFSTYIDRVIPSDRPRVQAALDRHLAEKEPFDVEHELVTDDGEIRTVRARGETSWDDAGQPIRMVGTICDTTAQHKQERDLLRAEQIAEFGSWFVELPAGKVRWSPQVYRIAGYEPHSIPVTLESGINHFHPDDRERVEKILTNAIEHGSSFQFDAIMVRPDGAERNVRIEGEAETRSDGTPLRIFGIVADQTKLKTQERELARSHRIQAIGQLVGGVAHDFNNILAVIMGNLELLEDMPLNEDGRSFVREALKATKHGAELTQSLLSFARVAPLQEEIIDPAARTREAVPLLTRLLPDNIAVRFETDEDPSSILCDPAMLDACIMNLVLNARDAMASGGTIVISVEHQVIDETAAAQVDLEIDTGSYVVIAVTDDGAGMTQTELDRATEPFFTTKKFGEGTGLGLSRAQGFAEQSRGFFKLYSEPGVGTTARIFLPAVFRPDMSMPIVDPSSASNNKLSGRVLLVEDQEAVRAVIAQNLRNMGLEVDVAASGDEGFELFEADPKYQAIVTDLVMPGRLQGADLVRSLRENGHEFGVIYVSGYSANGPAQENELLETDAHLSKPVSRSQLHAALGNILEI